MPLRHEYKIELAPADLPPLRARLRAVAKPDPHAPDGRYQVRSLYFDTWSDTALREKLDGVDRRQKFRLRLYNGDTAHVFLEKKSKYGALGDKVKTPLTPQQAAQLLRGTPAWMAADPRAPVPELYAAMLRGLRPKTIVEYTREAFICAPGNVRVTLDYDIRTGVLWAGSDFLAPRCCTVPAGAAPLLLEVKWDTVLPAAIRDAVALPGRQAGSFSKYAQCRVYG